jgi:methylmalonyl-CoA mutase
MLVFGFATGFELPLSPAKYTMFKPDFSRFSHINFQKYTPEKTVDVTFFQTREEIALPSKLEAFEAELTNEAVPGKPPFLRGPYASMYTLQPWTIRQYAGFSTAKESNAFYRRNLAGGQKGLSVAFDLPTHRGYDSDHPRASGDVGAAGVAVDTVEDMKILFQDIPLDKISVSMTMNGAVLPILACYIVAAKEQGVAIEQLSGTIQNDILKEFLIRNTFIYPPKASMEIVGEIFRYSAIHMPKFNPISISGYHMHEGGAPANLELAFTLADGVAYIEKGIESGLTIDEFAPRLSFFWAIGMHFLMEVAKMRAGRALWSDIVKSFGSQNPKSQALRTHCQTSGWSLTAQEPYNNVARTCIEALAAALGHTQSLHTNSLDEAIALPTDYSARIARNTQIYLIGETGITKAIDPWAGSYLMEYLTTTLMEKASAEIAGTRQQGGMLAAIENGSAKLKIESAATLLQAKIDGGESKLIGINLNQPLNNTDIKVLTINNKAIVEAQVAFLKEVKSKRNEALVSQCLSKLETKAKNLVEKVADGENLLALAVEAVEARATLGEISWALEKVFGRYTLHAGMVKGVYGQQAMDQEEVKETLKLADEFEKWDGRRPRILVAKIGQDGHDRGAKIVASAFADLGFDVDVGSLFQLPEEVADTAIENDVHIVGISSLAGAHKVLVPQLIEALKERNRDDMLVVVGGVIPPEDYEALQQAGVSLIFSPGTPIAVSARAILKKLMGY